MRSYYDSVLLCTYIGTGESGFAWTVRDSIRILVLIIGLQYGPDVSISDLRYTITTAIDFASTMYVVSHMNVVDLIYLKWGLAMLMGAAPPRSPGLPRPARGGGPRKLTAAHPRHGEYFPQYWPRIDTAYSSAPPHKDYQYGHHRPNRRCIMAKDPKYAPYGLNRPALTGRGGTTRTRNKIDTWR